MSWLYVLINKNCKKNCRERMCKTGFKNGLQLSYLYRWLCIEIMFSVCGAAKQMDNVKLF